MRDPEHFWFLAPTLEGTTVTISQNEGSHAVTVLRARKGTELTITDGLGCIARCQLENAGPADFTVTVLERHYREPLKPQLTLAVGLAEKEPFEQMLENCAPFEIARIVPLVCQRCQKPWWQNWDKQCARLYRKLESAVKQSHSPWLPILDSPRPFKDFAVSTPRLLIAHDTGGIVSHTAEPTTVLIGPPGGFTQQEIDYSLGLGAHPLSLGPWRLRTEMAATAAVLLLRRPIIESPA